MAQTHLELEQWRIAGPRLRVVEPDNRRDLDLAAPADHAVEDKEVRDAAVDHVATERIVRIGIQPAVGRSPGWIVFDCPDGSIELLASPGRYQFQEESDVPAADRVSGRRSPPTQARGEGRSCGRSGPC